MTYSKPKSSYPLRYNVPRLHSQGGLWETFRDHSPLYLAGSISRISSQQGAQERYACCYYRCLFGLVVIFGYSNSGISLSESLVCPPYVLGVTVTLIGVQLTGAGIRFWGGGVGCSGNPSADNPCPGNGEVQLGYGSGPYVGLGFAVFLIFLLVEVFGSPFMRNTMVIWGLLGGYAISAMAAHEGDRFVTTDRMKDSDAFTFLWVETFPIGIHGPAVIPMLFAFVVTAMETMGDVTATEHASRLRPTGEEHAKRIQGGLLGDSIATFFAALGTTPP